MAYLARKLPLIDLSAVESNRIAGGAEHYDVIDTLAHGSTADLLLAVRRGAMGVDSLVVLKRLRTSPADDQRASDTFLQEARVSVRLRHGNIVHTFGCGEDYGAPFLAMEYLEGESLREVMRESAMRDVRLKPSLAVHIACEALKGLHYAHTLTDYDGRSLSFVHRDVSPHNIFIGYDGTVKLIDFGIAKTTLAVDKTAEGIVKGKVAYLSPEQTLGHPLDPRSDLFSLGITLWEMLSMQRLMVGNSAFDTMLRILNGESPRLSQVTTGISPALEEVVARSLAREKTLRYSTADEMRLALRERACLDTPRAGNEELADAMTVLFRDSRAAKERTIAGKMAELAHRGPRVSIPGPPLRSMGFGDAPGPEDVSMRFVGARSSSSPPPPDESGERISMPRRPSVATMHGLGDPETVLRPLSIKEIAVVNEASAIARIQHPRALSQAQPHVEPPPGKTIVPRARPRRKATERIARGWIVADVLLVAALAGAFAHEPTRERITSATFWRSLATSIGVQAARMTKDAFPK